MIDSVTSVGISALRLEAPPVEQATARSRPKSAAENSSADAVISTLSQQLSQSAGRAEVRDKTLNRRELGIEAERLLGQITGNAYYAARSLHNTERPQTNDPELLARARQATDYVVKWDLRDYSVKNPFSGLSREQLNLIVYDEQGAYTVNERRAAWSEIDDMERRWNTQVMQIYRQESAANSPNTPRFCTEVLAHYRTLPAIEQAQYPDNYEERLQAEIDNTERPAEDTRKLSLFEMLEALQGARKLPTDRAESTVEHVSPTKEETPL